MRADCIRVTHPYATLGSLLLKILPFSLHVLGLPLAFILSQDQTLHSINPLSDFYLLHLFSDSSFHPTILCPWPHSSSCPCLKSPLGSSRHLFKNQLEVNLYRSTPGPLSISIYSMNVYGIPHEVPCYQDNVLREFRTEV